MAGRETEATAGGLLERPALPFDADSTFVLAAGGLRRLRGSGQAFLGYTGGEMFWRDVLELVHADDRARAEKLVSGTVGRPEATLNAGLRLRDASGHWRPVKATVWNAAEAPGDPGLVLADFRDPRPVDGDDRP